MLIHVAHTVLMMCLLYCPRQHGPSCWMLQLVVLIQTFTTAGCA